MIAGRRYIVKIRKHKQENGAVNLTAREHLEVQREIEKRAHELWRIGGCRQTATLDEWLQAEREIIERFLWKRFGAGAFQSSSRNSNHRGKRSSGRSCAPGWRTAGYTQLRPSHE
jgi:hypothetical protein